MKMINKLVSDLYLGNLSKVYDFTDKNEPSMEILQYFS